MGFTATNIPEVLVFNPQVFGDERGFFMETFRQSDFEQLGLGIQFVQDNHSGSSQGVLRGLHYQINKPQGKLVRVISGEVFDVAVDLRKGSTTFGQWAGQILSAKNRKSMWVPPGFAHGFYVLSDRAEFVYKCTAYYAPDGERAIRWDDPDLAIEWPLIAGVSPSLSIKDQAAKSFKEAEYFTCDDC